ncbi:MAG: hypothetical protein R3C58_13965 [Parvularculaceae bacterium]
MKFGFGVLAALMVSTIAQAADYPDMVPSQVAVTADAVVQGVNAYRAHDFAGARMLLQPAASDGDLRAMRYLGYATLDDQRAKPEDLKTGVALLTKAALDGDYAALIRLEDLRRQNLAHSPSLTDIVAIEKARAEAGDPVTAWRLARRVDDGEALAGDDAAKWLAVAAAAELSDFPKAGDAAFRLCEMRASGDDAAEARRWCQKAADSGHAGAAIMLRRLASLN